MTNKLAPYKNPQIMARVEEWWADAYPTNTTYSAGEFIDVIDLYKQYLSYVEHDATTDAWLDPNQFAKCLIAAKICDIGGYFEKLPNWEPKEYELRRARAY